MKNNVGLFLQKRAQLNPGLEAFIDTHSGRRLSFADLDASANRTAHFLARELGVRKGDRVALLMMNSPEFLESFFAIAKAGAKHKSFAPEFLIWAMAPAGGSPPASTICPTLRWTQVSMSAGNSG